MTTDRKLDYTTLNTLWRTQRQHTPHYAFQAKTKEEWSHWQSALLARLSERLGAFPTTQPPLDPTLLSVAEYDDYRQEYIAFQSESGIYVPCYVLIPHHAKPPYRPVIALHGHGRGGAAHVVGLTVDKSTQAAETEHIHLHNYDYGRQLARHGFLVFVPEQRGFGRRMELHPGMISGTDLWQSSCRALAYNALLLGKTLLGLRVWDVMRTLDYITSRAEPLVNGVGCIGLSGGGTTTLYSAALDKRISVAVISGAFGDFHSSIMTTIHCDCNYIPGILQDADMADIAALIAPRPLLVENGTEDPIFPVAKTIAACEQVNRAYTLLNACERFEQDIFAGGHRFNGDKAIPWLARWLTPEQHPQPEHLHLAE